jgi:hypothetical protein
VTNRICQQCKYGMYAGGESFKCDAPQNRVLNVVTGNPQRRYNFCEFLRGHGWVDCRLSKTCGKEGRWFKPKERQQPLPLDF